MLIGDIKRCMEAVSADEQTLEASFVYPDDFIGFQGHFPGMPVLPGICTIQSLLVALESSWRARVALREIHSAKFFVAIRPREPIQFHCSMEPHDADRCAVRARVARMGKRLAEFRIEVNHYSPDNLL